MGAKARLHDRSVRNNDSLVEIYSVQSVGAKARLHDRSEIMIALLSFISENFKKCPSFSPFHIAQKESHAVICFFTSAKRCEKLFH